MITIDSTKIRIPYHVVQIVSDTLEDARFEINSAGEIIREWKSNSHKVENNGIKIRYAIQSQNAGDGRTYKYLVIEFNSKLLKENYLDGISQSNIKAVYDAIIEQNIIHVTYEQFEAGELTDTDFKEDKVAKSYTAIFDKIVQNSKAHRQVNRGCNLFNKKGNKGVEFGKRNTASASYPYLKFYNKWLELYNDKTRGSYLFATTYGIKLDKNTIRCEYTVKDAKQWKRYGIQERTLKAILALDQDKLKEIQSKIVNGHLNPRLPQITKRMNKDMTPDNTIKCNLMAFLLLKGYSIEQIFMLSLEQIESKSARSKKRKQLTELYELYVKDTKESKMSMHLNEYFDGLGWKW